MRRDLYATALLSVLLLWVPVVVSQAPGSDIERYLRQAQNGHVQSQAYVAYLYYSGQGVPRDYEQAAHWFRLAAEQRHVDAQYNMGVLNAHGHGLARDPAEAARWYKLAAEQGHAKAMYRFGLACLQGNGVAQDMGCAQGWLQKVARTGHVEAQIRLASLYFQNADDEQSAEQAAHWYEQAANQGHPVAQHNLGLLYHHGTGVEKNGAQAVYWLERAQAQGYEPSFEWLQRLGQQVVVEKATESLVPAAPILAVDIEAMRSAGGQGEEIPASGPAGTQETGGMASEPAGMPETQGMASEPAGTPETQGMASEPAGMPETQGMASEPAGTPETQSMASEPAGTPETQGMASEPAGTPETQGMASEPAGAPETQSMASEPAGAPEGQSVVAVTDARSPDTGLNESQDQRRSHVVSPPLDKTGTMRGWEDIDEGDHVTVAAGPDDAAVTTTAPFRGVTPPITSGENTDTVAGMRDGDAVVDGPAAGMLAESPPRIPETVQGETGVAVTGLAGLANAELQKKALSGDADAQIMLASRYYLGHRQVRDPALALHWMRRAAEGGSQQAQFLLGHFHMAGIGTKEDVIEAQFWYQVAHDGGHPDASGMLTRLPNVDASVLREDVYTQMSDLSNEDQDPQRDSALPAPSSADSSSAGDHGMEAPGIHSYETGLRHELGTGGSKRDLALALRWFREASEQGYAPAQHKLGVAYMYGNGVDKDHEQAIYWFQRAALQGYVLSQRNLALLYMGSAHTEHRPRAYAWLSVAARSGEPKDSQMLERIAKQMSPEEIDTGRHIAIGLIRAFDEDRGIVPLPEAY